MKFDGKAFAGEIEKEVAAKVTKLARKVKIVSVLVGSDSASEMYTRMKSKAAERVGIEFEVVRLETADGLGTKIQEIGAREDVTGVMVQLPVPDLQGQTLKEVLTAIPLNKDVDGLRWRESGVVPATVRAIMTILEEINTRSLDLLPPKAGRRDDRWIWKQKFVVLGSRGAVGAPLVVQLKKRGIEVAEVEWDTPEPARRVLAGEVVISCVGKAELITPAMVTNGAILVDVGGDMTKEVYAKASVSVENPGGVGPVTIASLMRSGYELAARLE